MPSKSIQSYFKTLKEVLKKTETTKTIMIYIANTDCSFMKWSTSNSMGKVGCLQVLSTCLLHKIFLVTRNIKQTFILYHYSFNKLFGSIMLPTQRELARFCLFQNILIVTVNFIFLYIKKYKTGSIRMTSTNKFKILFYWHQINKGHLYSAA